MLVQVKKSEREKNTYLELKTCVRLKPHPLSLLLWRCGGGGHAWTCQGGGGGCCWFLLVFVVVIVVVVVGTVRCIRKTQNCFFCTYFVLIHLIKN